MENSTTELTPLAKLIRNKDIDGLCKILFNVSITAGQKEIIESILDRRLRRVIISCFTRYGKTFAVAIGALLYILLNKRKRVVIIAPQYSQSERMRNYITELIHESKLMLAVLDINVSEFERIKKEVSKQRMTFKNGCELSIYSAEGEAFRLMGVGADIVVCEESGLISTDVYNTKISRMLGDSADSKLVEIGNPWFVRKEGSREFHHFFSHWHDKNFYKVHIDWKKGIEEGRVTQEFIDEQKKILTEMEFRVLYEAEFPSENQEYRLFKPEWVFNAIDEHIEAKAEKFIYGLDIAFGGGDKTVFTEIYVKDNKYYVTKIKWFDVTDNMELTGRLINEINNKATAEIHIEVTTGQGVADRLKELGYNVITFKSAQKPIAKDRFANTKAELYYNMRDIFMEGRIKIPSDENLIEELLAMDSKVAGSEGKIQIVDPTKSPDFADSLAYALYERRSTFSFVQLS